MKVVLTARVPVKKADGKPVYTGCGGIPFDDKELVIEESPDIEEDLVLTVDGQQYSVDAHELASAATMFADSFERGG